MPLLLLPLFLTSCDAVSEPEIEVLPYTGPDVVWEKQPDWEASEMGGLVVLKFSMRNYWKNRDQYLTYMGGIGPGEMFTLTLRDTGSDLPSYVSLIRSPDPDYDGPTKPIRMGPMTEGKIYIHTWDLEGAIQGRIDGNVGAMEIESFIHFRANLAIDNDSD